MQTRIITYPADLSSKTLSEIIRLFADHKWIVPEKYGNLSTTYPSPSKFNEDVLKEVYDFYKDNPSLLIYGKGQRYLDFYRTEKGFPFSGAIDHYKDTTGHADFESADYDEAIVQVMQLSNALYGESQDRAARAHYLYRYEQHGGGRRRVLTVKGLAGLTNPAWKMWFSERYIQAIGREKLLSAPARAIRDFGKIIFVNVFKNPTEWNSVDALKAVDDFKTHVGYDFFYDQEEPGKQLRMPDFSDL